MARRNVFREAFEPVLAIGDLCVFLGGSGFKQAKDGGSGLYVCTDVFPTNMSLSQHGVLVVWADSGTSPTGYLADSGMNTSTNHIGAGSQYGYQLQSLQFSKGQFAQLRFRLKFFATVTGVVDDYDVTLWSPPSSQTAKFLHIGGVLNSMFQSQDPGDSILAPAQGSNITLPAVFPALPPSAWSLRTQLFLMEDASVQVQIQNNGASITSGGAIGLAISGFVYNFEPIENYDDSLQLGAPVQLLPGTSPLQLPVGYNPDDVVVLPVEVRAPR
jgi:hypothetical protein